MSKMNSKWDEEQKRLYTRVHHYMQRVPQADFAHPEAAPVPKEHWETIAHNAAFTAAEELRSTASHVVTEDAGGKVLDDTKVT